MDEMTKRYYGQKESVLLTEARAQEMFPELYQAINYQNMENWQESEQTFLREKIWQVRATGETGTLIAFMCPQLTGWVHGHYEPLCFLWLAF